MPIYEFECPSGHKEERLLTIAEMERVKLHKMDIFCSFMERYGPCDLIMELIWSKPANIQIAKPTIVYKDRRTGVIEFAGPNTNELKGYERIEVKGPIERSKVEAEFNKQRKEELEVRMEMSRIQTEESRKARQADTNARLNAVQHEIIDGKTESFTLDSQTKDLVKKAQERSRNKSKRRKKINETGFEVNHYDSNTIKNRD